MCGELLGDGAARRKPLHADALLAKLQEVHEPQTERGTQADVEKHVPTPSRAFERTSMKEEFRRIAAERGIQMPTRETIANNLRKREEKTEQPPSQPLNSEFRRNRPALKGAGLLEKYDEVQGKKSTTTVRNIAHEIGIRLQTAERLSQAPRFTPQMRELIVRDNVGLDSAVILSKFPSQLQSTLAHEWGNGSITNQQLRYVLYWSREGGRSMRHVLNEVGFTMWPEELNDDGIPKQK